MASTDIWSDFETLKQNVNGIRVDRLKQILTGFNEECSTVFGKSGRKHDLVTRIVTQLDNWRQTNNTDKWAKAKAVFYQVRTSGFYTPGLISTNAPTQSASLPFHNPYASINTKPIIYQPTPGGSSAVSRYDPHAASRNPPTVPVTLSSSTIKPGIRFKPSPFFHIDQIVSPVIECPESASANDRRQQAVTFTLNSDQISKLKYNSSRYQLRLFCTSSMFYSPGMTSFRVNTTPCPIEFPPTCEVRVNNVQLTANLKGLKKKPGTAPPADLGKAVRISSIQNRVEMVYVNSQQPVQHKKFYLVVMLVEVTTVDGLVNELKKGRYRSSNDVRRKMVASMSEDDDIIAGPQKMSLKCPLSFMRVSTPCRSERCVHPQCFDATSWFSMMEQTTTWLCPVCEKVLNHEDLIIDGYFDEILKRCPDSVEDVTVESDGQWHTADGKYGSEGWKASHSLPTITPTPTPRKSSVVKTPLGSSRSTSNQDVNANTDDLEIVVLDSDDEDEGRVKRELSPSFGRDSSVVAHQSTLVPRSQSQVIDLTLDSDEDEPPVPRRAEKRKAPVAGMSPTEQIWKKGRQDHEPASVMPAHVGAAGRPSDFGGNAYSQFPNVSHNTAHIEPPTAQYISPYPTTVFSHYTPLPPRAETSIISNTPLPPIGGSTFLPRINARWPGT